MLGTDLDGLLYWDKFGRNKEVFLSDGKLAAVLDDPELMVIALSLQSQMTRLA